jgi:surface protein
MANKEVRKKIPFDEFRNMDGRGKRELTGLDLSDADTSGMESMAHMFGWCDKLEELDLSSFDTSDVRSMQGMFAHCSALKKLDLTGFDTSGVENMAYMFQGCEALETLDLSGFDFTRVKTMACMFMGSYRLREVIVSNTFRKAKCMRALKEKSGRKGHNGEYWVGADTSSVFTDGDGRHYMLGEGNTPSQAYENRIYVDESASDSMEQRMRAELCLNNSAKLIIVPLRK